jgi:hypothetical protein
VRHARPVDKPDNEMRGRKPEGGTTTNRAGELMTSPVAKNGRAMWTCRPTPTEVAAILSNLEPTGSVVTVPALVAALRRETGCSRATAYRAVAAALAFGDITRANTC